MDNHILNVKIWETQDFIKMFSSMKCYMNYCCLVFDSDESKITATTNSAYDDIRIDFCLQGETLNFLKCQDKKFQIGISIPDIYDRLLLFLNEKDPIIMYITRSKPDILHIEQEEIFMKYKLISYKNEYENIDIAFENRIELSTKSFFDAVRYFYTLNTMYMWTDLSSTRIKFCAWRNRKLDDSAIFKFKRHTKIYTNKRCTNIYKSNNLYSVAKVILSLGCTVVNIYQKNNDKMGIMVDIGSIGKVNFLVKHHIVTLESPLSLVEQCYSKLAKLHSKDEMDRLIMKLFPELPEQIIKMKSNE